MRLAQNKISCAIPASVLSSERGSHPAGTFLLLECYSYCQDWDHRRHGAIIYIIYIYITISFFIIAPLIVIKFAWFQTGAIIFHWHSLTLSTAVCCMRSGIYAHLGGVLGQCGGWGHVQHLGKVQWCGCRRAWAMLDLRWVGQQHWKSLLVFGKLRRTNSEMGVSENVEHPIVPNGFADHYPYEKWLFH